MHHGQGRRKRNTGKVCKKQVNLSKTEVKICGSRGKFSRNKGKCTETAKMGGIRNLWSMTKKRSSEISADENLKQFREKEKLLKFSSESEHFSKIKGEI